MERRRPAEINAAIEGIVIDGVLTSEMAAEVKVSARALQRRVATHQLTRLGESTFAIAGAPRTTRLLQRAALLHTGASALVYWSAAFAHGCSAGPPDRVQVAIEPSRRVTSTDWFDVRRLRAVEDDEIVELDDFPVTTMARTIRDYAALLAVRPSSEKKLRDLTLEALIKQRLDLDDLTLMLNRERGSVAARRLDEIIAYETGRDSANLKSVGEAWLRDLVVERGWPMPKFNVVLPDTGHELDAYWERERVGVEFDGFVVHKHRTKHDRDRRRDRRVQRTERILIRVTSTDLKQFRDETADDIGYWLALRG